MIIRLRGGRVYDPANGVDGEVRDIWIRDGRVIAAPAGDPGAVQEHHLDGAVVMAGGIDMHTHIGGGKVNIARAMLADMQSPVAADAALPRAGTEGFAPSAPVTGYRYAQMGYTTCFEPAVLPANARQAHMEMADCAQLDTGGYAILGNDDLLLGMLANGAEQPLINDYVAWTLRDTQCIGIKVVNAGGINAFKFNTRKLDVDEIGPHYGVRPRDVVRVLSAALDDLRVPHPLHVHSSNLGIPGNVGSTLATIDAAEGRPIHLTHVQFHSYGDEGRYGFSSAAARIADAVNNSRNVTIDVGQVMFGQTVTVSADAMLQHRNRGFASPRKWVCMDIECDAGCGVVPFRYRHKQFVNALQWAIGLELFLMVKDPWRVFLTTDHPNGAPFTSYPKLIRLLMDRSYRNDVLDTLHPAAGRMSALQGIEREYTLGEIAVMTRAGPARVLGLADHGHLGPGAVADVAVYRPDDDIERMFEAPTLVLKAGEAIVRDGVVTATVAGRTHVVRPSYDDGIERTLAAHFDAHSTVRLGNFRISDDEMAEHIGSAVVVHPCRGERAL